MVVGPRFNPPGPPTASAPSARGTAGASGQATEVQYLRPGERSGHDISLRVEVDAGVRHRGDPLRDPPDHDAVAGPRPRGRDAAAPDSVPNKDFVLRYRVAGRGDQVGLLTHRDERGGYFTLMLLPAGGAGAT